jgi:hypothetical protein
MDAGGGVSKTRTGETDSGATEETLMIRGDRWRSFLLRADRSIALGFDRLPWWSQPLLLPLAALVARVEGASYFPRAAAVAAVTLAGVLLGVYVPLIRSGVIAFSWAGAVSVLGRECIALIGSLYFAALLCLWMAIVARLQEALLRWAGRAKPSELERATRLWDREIDG